VIARGRPSPATVATSARAPKGPAGVHEKRTTSIVGPGARGEQTLWPGNCNLAGYAGFGAVLYLVSAARAHR
jgi:hypothetical protein